ILTFKIKKYVTEYNLEEVRLRISQGNSFVTNTTSYPLTYYGIIEIERPFFWEGDFDGDGAMDYLMVLRNRYNDPPPYAKVYFNSPRRGIYNQEVAVPFEIYPAGGSVDHYAFRLGECDKTMVLDFDGDGANEIMFLKGATCGIVKLKNTGSTYSLERVYNSGYPTVWHDNLSMGDFNGDGKSDLLSVDNASQVVTIGMSTGKSFLESTLTLQNKYSEGCTILTGQGCDNLVIGDIDGDGKSEIVHHDVEYVPNVGYHDGFYTYNLQGDHWNHQYFQNANEGIKTFALTDVNGDGKLDF